MSLARAFTTRRVKQSLQAADGETMPTRSNTTKGNRSIRSKISGPVQLVHTTNMLSYNAPDITPKSASSITSITSSSKSDDDLSDAARSHASSPPTSPDVPSPPKQMSTAEPNHLSCYFSPPGQTEMAKKPDAPVIPQRALSHTKPYEGLSTQRSTARLSQQSHRTVSTKGSFSFSRASSSSTSTSNTSTSTPPPTHQMPKASSPAMPSFSATSSPAPYGAPSSSPARSPAPRLGSNKLAPIQQHLQQNKQLTQSQHPFGPELAQVTEIAEEYGVKERLNVLDREAEEMMSRRLCKIHADDYLADIDELYNHFFPELTRRVTPATAPIAAAPASVWI